jgi:hypothetical protein
MKVKNPEYKRALDYFKSCQKIYVNLYNKRRDPSVEAELKRSYNSLVEARELLENVPEYIEE